PVAQYDAEIAYVDLALAHVFNRLEELGMDDDTLVAVVADHGEIMDEHEGYFDHHGLYEGNVHVPLILRHPGRLPAGQVVDATVQLFDVAPTILDLVGAGDAPRQAGMPGRSLLPTLGGAPGADAIYLTECTWMRKRAIRADGWKLIQAMETDLHGLPRHQLFDLRADPGERRNLADQRPE